MTLRLPLKVMVSAVLQLTASGLHEMTMIPVMAKIYEDNGDFVDNSLVNVTSEFSVQFGNPDSDGVYQGDLTITIDDDDIGEPTGEFIILLQPNLTTYRLGTAIRSVVTVWDDDLPALSIAPTVPVVESQSPFAAYIISAVASPNAAIDVTYTYTETSTFIDGEGTLKQANLDFSNNEKNVRLYVPFESDTTPEENGFITVTLSEDKSITPKYLVAAAPNNAATMEVFDDDSIPTISVVEDSGVSYENSLMEFDLIATGLLNNATLDLTATFSEVDGDFLSTNQEGRQLYRLVAFRDSDNDNIYTGQFSLFPDNDFTPEPSGRVKMRLDEDFRTVDTYRVGANSEGFIRIYDDEAPELSVRTAITEITEPSTGQANLVFSFNTEFSPRSVIPINYNLIQSGNFITGAGTGLTATLDFTNGRKEAFLPNIPILNDNIAEADGSVTLTLLPDTAVRKRYFPAPNNTASIEIFDDDSLPTVSVLPDSGVASEGDGVAYFKLTTTNLSEETTLLIDATPDESGANFLTTNIQGYLNKWSVRFNDPDGDGIYTGNLAVALDNDNIAEESGKIKLRIQHDVDIVKSYQRGTVTEGEIKILDDDVPELTITGQNSVTEDDNETVDYLISAVFSPNSNITVRYNLSESSDFIASTEEGTGKTETLDFRNGVKEAVLSIPVSNDNDNEITGTVSVTLTADNLNPITYSVAASPDNSADVTVYDDDSDPIVSIAALSGETMESDDPAKFKVFATGLTSTTTIMINATPAEDGSDFLTDAIAGTATDYAVEFVDADGDSTYSGIISVPTHNDVTSETPGTIKLTLNAKSGTYRLGSTTEGTIRILDDDAPELKIVAENSVIEGENVSAKFIVSSTFSPNKTIDVIYDLAESGSYIGSEGTNKTVS